MEANAVLQTLAEALSKNIKVSARSVAEALDYNELAQEVASELAYNDIASELDYDELASRVDLDDLARKVDLSDLAAEWDLCEVADAINPARVAIELNLEAVAAKLPCETIAQHFSNQNPTPLRELERRLAEVEATMEMRAAASQPAKDAAARAGEDLLSEVYSANMVFVVEEGRFVSKASVLEKRVDQGLRELEARINEQDGVLGQILTEQRNMQMRIDTAAPITGQRMAARFETEDLREMLTDCRLRLEAVERSTRALYEAFLQGYAKAMEARP